MTWHEGWSLEPRGEPEHCALRPGPGVRVRRKRDEWLPVEDWNLAA